MISRFQRLFAPLALALALGALAGCGRARLPVGWYVPARANLEARERFRGHAFGLAFHWGLQSALAEGDAPLAEGRLDGEELERLADEFAVSGFDAAAWADLAKAAGARYVAFEARGADGFAMFASRHSDWSVEKRSEVDPLKLLAAECAARELELFASYSQIDRHDADYSPRARGPLVAGLPGGKAWKRYLRRVDADIKDLISDYESLAGLRLAHQADNSRADWQLPRRYAALHKARPALLVANDAPGGAREGEDYAIAGAALLDAEAELPAPAPERDGLPLEIEMTINDSRSWNASDKNFKEPRDLIRAIVRASGHDANLLLSVGAKPDGSLPPEFSSRLAETGRWLARNGESLYETRGGPLSPGAWGVSTQRRGKIYIHYLAPHAGTLTFPSNLGDLRSAYLFSSGASIDVTLSGETYVIEIPQEIIDPIDTILVLEVRPDAQG